MRKLVLTTLILLLTISACSMPGATPLLPTNSTGPTLPPTPLDVTITVYFMDVARFNVGTEPYEAGVTRTIPMPSSLPEAVLTQLFLGPTDAEKAQGLALVLSGTTGFSNLKIEDGIARVYLTGTCNSQGSTYTIANLIDANLQQFPEIQWVKIYDQNGETETPDGQSGSIPFCLEP
jgi:hypothetical protein